MEAYIGEDGYARLKARLATASGAGRLPLLAQTAWHARQRDSALALALAAEAQAEAARPGPEPKLEQGTESEPEPGTGSGPEPGTGTGTESEPGTEPETATDSWPDQTQRDSLCAYLKLAQCEAHYLEGRHTEAHALASDALEFFRQAGDFSGCAEAHWQLSNISSGRLNFQQRIAILEESEQAANRAGDHLRAGMARAQTALITMFIDATQARARWDGEFGQEDPAQHPAVAATAAEYRSMAAGFSNDFVHSAALMVQSFNLSLETGQIQRAIRLASNIGDNFNHLLDHDAALEWMQRGLDLARPRGWPSGLHLCLQQSGETLRLLGQFAAAQPLLDEALQHTSQFPNARSHALSLQYSGNLALDRAQHQEALSLFQQLEAHSRQGGHLDLLGFGLAGQAEALLHLGQVPAALAAAQGALEHAEARRDGIGQVGALRVLAKLHARLDLEQAGPGVERPALRFLLRALDVASGMPGQPVPPELLAELAQAHAEAGGHRAAFDFAKEASAAHTRVHSNQARNHATALQVRLETERTYAEIARHRQLAQAETQRAELLRQTNETLGLLGQVGQEITAHLEAGAVCATLARHVESLLEAHFFGIYRMNAEGTALVSVFAREEGKTLPQTTISMDRTGARSVQCVLRREDFAVDVAPEEISPNWRPGSLRTHSALFGPLMVDERVMGVMSIQSSRRFAYGERERMVFRTLCGYGAIALANAEVLDALRQTQTRLAQQEKLAALGGLVAGVAHEINTPLGVTLTSLSAISNAWKQLRDAAAANRLSRQLLESNLDSGLEFTELARRNASRAAALVASFKDLAAPQAQGGSEEVELGQFVREVAQPICAALERLGHRTEFDTPSPLPVSVQCGPLAQALAQVLSNVADHAFAPDTSGLLRLSTRRAPDGRPEIVIEDSGCGIPETELPKVFDPFFTTKGGSGGHVGLGLHVAHSQVVRALGGTLEIGSRPGQGTRVALRLPGRAAWETDEG